MPKGRIVEISAENKLEEILRLAADEPAHRPQFCEVLLSSQRSEERRVGKECRYRWAQYQAEDGIRDADVTGVQTCALPIWSSMHNKALKQGRADARRLAWRYA